MPFSYTLRRANATIGIKKPKVTQEANGDKESGQESLRATLCCGYDAANEYASHNNCVGPAKDLRCRRRLQQCKAQGKAPEVCNTKCLCVITR